MWTRKSVKQKGKGSFFKNFWKCVLVGLILATILGAMNGGGSGGSGISSFTSILANQDSGDVTVTDPAEDLGDNDVIADSTDTHIDFSFSADDGNTHDITGFAIVGLILVFLVVTLIITAIALAVKYFLLVPFEYGCRKFFRKNLEEPAKLSNIVYVFDSHYKNIVKTAFMRNLFISLWSLLFIVPGIIKAYEYRMVPYIMSEDPTMNYKDALAESKRLMTGNEWKSFVLDLSFIGWDILSVMTWGILEIFFVAPYKASTDAALYESLKYGIDVK